MMSSNMTQAQFNSFLKKAVSEVELSIKDKLPKDSSYKIFHVYKDAGKQNGYKRHVQWPFKHISGITFLFLNHKGYTYVYTSHCHNEDTYSRAFGRKEVLSRLNKDVESKFSSSNYEFVVPNNSSLSRKDFEDALINLKLMTPRYNNLLKRRTPSLKPNSLIEDLNGTPLLVKNTYIFINDQGSIVSTYPIETYDSTIHSDTNYQVNFLEFLSSLED